MTIAGANKRADIWRINYRPDDVVGGAITSGTVVHSSVPIRFQEEPQQLLLLQQGLETQRTYTATVVPGTLDIRERDEIQIVEPFDDPYHNQFFRIVGVRYSDFNVRDPRNFMMLQMVRSVRAHDNQ